MVLKNEDKINQTVDLIGDTIIIGGIDSLGVPYTPDNFDKKNYLSLVVDRLEQVGGKIQKFDLHNMVRNKTWEFDMYFDKDYSIAEIKNKHRKYFRLMEKSYHYPISSNFANLYYREEDGDENKKLKTSLLNSEKPIFIYSCGANDASTYFGFDSISPSSVYRLIFQRLKYFSKIAQNIENNLSAIWSINSSTQIYILGGYAAVANPQLRKIVKPIYDLYNSQIKSMCEKHPNAIYVDISVVEQFIAPNDMHPNREGQELIADSVLNCIYEKNIRNVKYK